MKIRQYTKIRRFYAWIGFLALVAIVFFALGYGYQWLKDSGIIVINVVR